MPRDIRTPTITHPSAELDRPGFAATGQASDSERTKVLAAPLGLVSEVFAIRIVLAFAPPKEFN